MYVFQFGSSISLLLLRRRKFLCGRCGRCGRDRGGQHVGVSCAGLLRVNTNSFVFIMIYDIDSQAWWIRTIPCKGGVRVVRYYCSRVRDWYLVLDPFSTRRYYWVDRSNKVCRASPPPLDKDASTQTCDELFVVCCGEAASLTDSADCEDFECGTLGLFSSGSPFDTDVIAVSGSSIVGRSWQRRMVVNDLSVGVQAGAFDSGTGSGECSSRSPALVIRRLGHKGWKLKNMPLTRVDLHFRKIEDRLRRQIALLERTPEHVLSVLYWWKRFSLFLIDRLVAVTRSKLFKARRGWFILVSRYRRRLHEAMCFKASHSVIRVCQQAGFWLSTNRAFWPHRRARNRCLVCVANYISSRDCVDRKKLLSRARHLWQGLPSQQCSLVNHVVRTHGDLGNARFCPGCNKLCASENGVFMHSAVCKSLGRALKTVVDAAGA